MKSSSLSIYGNIASPGGSQNIKYESLNFDDDSQSKYERINDDVDTQRNENTDELQ